MNKAPSKLKTELGLYLQVPISVFATEKTDAAVLNTLIAVGCRYVGRVLRDGSPNYQASRLAEACRKAPKDYRGSPDEKDVLVGANSLNITYWTMLPVVAQLNRFDDFRAKLERLTGGVDASVRVKKDLAFEALTGKGISFRDLSVMVAIISIIGRRRLAVRITQKHIRNRAAGFRSDDVRESAIKAGLCEPRLLSDWELRSTLTRLADRGLVHRHTYNRRLTYYGFGMSAREFKESLERRLLAKSERAILRRTEEIQFNRSIENQRAALRGLPPPYPDALPPASTAYPSDAPFE